MIFSILWIGSVVAAIVVADRKGRSVVGFGFLALLFGPLALVIALLVDSRTGSPGIRSESGPPSLLGLRNQLTAANTALRGLQERIRRIEDQLSALERSAVPGAADPAPAAGSVIADHPPAESGTGRPADAPPPEALEIVLAKYWLNRVGAVLFVIGVGLFISFSFQYMPAVVKIAIGYALAAAFLWGGARLEKVPRYEKLSWGISGGGWGLLYLAAYAMHYIPSTRLIANPWIELIFLSAVSAAAVAWNLRYRSSVVTALTFLLAFLTAGLGGLSYPLIGYWALLIFSITLIAMRRSWLMLLALMMVPAYLTPIFWADADAGTWSLIGTLWNQGLSRQDFWIGMILMAVGWVAFAAALLCWPGREQRERELVAANLGNSGLFAGMGLIMIESTRWGFPSADPRFAFLSGVAGLSLLAAGLSGYLGRGRMVVAHIAAAAVLWAWAAVIRFAPEAVSFLWLAETAALLTLGIYYREKIYRALGAAGSLLVLIRLGMGDVPGTEPLGWLGMSSHMLLGRLCVLGCLSMGFLRTRSFIQNRLSPEEGRLYQVYALAGAMFGVFLFAEEMPERWLTLGWTGWGVAVLALGIMMKDKVTRVSALGVLSLACLRLVVSDLSGVNTLYKITAFTGLGIILLAVSGVYSRLLVGVDRGTVPSQDQGNGCAGNSVGDIG